MFAQSDPITWANEIGNGTKTELIEEYISHNANDAGPSKPADRFLEIVNYQISTMDFNERFQYPYNVIQDEGNAE